MRALPAARRRKRPISRRTRLPQTLPGWKENADEVTELDALPAKARSYAEFVERARGAGLADRHRGERERLTPGPVEALARP